MIHTRGISPTNLFIHFLRRGNLTLGLIHLHHVFETPAPPGDTAVGGGVEDADPAHLHRRYDVAIGHFSTQVFVFHAEVKFRVVRKDGGSVGEIFRLGARPEVGNRPLARVSC